MRFFTQLNFHRNQNLCPFTGLISVNADLATNDEQKAAQNFQKETRDQKMYSSGKAPPKDGNSLNWMNDVIEEPQPLTLKLARLDTLDPLRKYLKKKPVILKYIKQGLMEYCEHLKGKGAVSLCESPNPDNQLPKSRYLQNVLSGFPSYILRIVIRGDDYQLRSLK